MDIGEKRKFSTGAPLSVRAVDQNNGMKIEYLFPCQFAKASNNILR